MITHLLTQVRIGMDLTKITLPTFILEPRSLLEMYADFFAHTDLFLEYESFVLVCLKILILGPMTIKE